MKNGVIEIKIGGHQEFQGFNIKAVYLISTTPNKHVRVFKLEKLT